MKRSLLIVCALLVTLAPSSASALRITTNVSLLAWSVDGEAALLMQHRHGPEGGGSRTYLLVRAKPPGVVRAVVSSDFSPGDGSTPQTVSPSESSG